MDHSIDKLDECVFDYLSAHPDQPKSFTRIYNDISGETGHRCSELNNHVNHQRYKDKFMTICYTLDRTWKCIYKVFLTDDAIPYLIFSNKTYAEVLEFCNVSNIVYDTAGSMDTHALDDIVNFMIVNASTRDSSDIDDNLLQYLVCKNKTRELLKIFDLYDVKLNNFDTLLNTALQNSFSDLVKVLIDKQNNTIKKHNELLTKELGLLQRKNENLVNDNEELSLELRTANFNLEIAKSEQRILSTQYKTSIQQCNAIRKNNETLSSRFATVCSMLFFETLYLFLC